MLGRNRVPYQLVAVVALLIIPIGIFGRFFVQQSNKDIAFAQKEIAGVEYLEALMPILADLADNRTPEKSLVDEFKEAAQRHDSAMLSQDESARLLDLLVKPQTGSGIEKARRLITRIGDQSNLILDPDLDSYYLMDAVLLRLPEIVEMSGQLAESERPGFDLQSLARFEIARMGLVHSFAAAYEANVDGSLKTRLGAAGHHFDQHLIAAAGEWRSRPAKASSTTQTVNMAALQFWNNAATELKRLLRTRIDGFSKRLFTALAIGIGVATAALLLAISILKHVLSRLDDRIVYLAHRDLLTGLFNRSSISEEIQKAIALAGKSGGQVAIHLIDLDRFKWINDAFGHHAGDEVIKEMGTRLQSLAANNCAVGRLGGDEFIVVQTGIRDVQDALTLGESICAVMRQPFEIDDQPIRTSSSIGIALWPRHADNEASLMKCADIALYKAKGAGKNRPLAFTSMFADELHAKNVIESAVRDAVDEDAFSLAFQPLFDVTGQQLKGFEALLRLDGYDGKPISPAVFVPIAEQLNLISKIGAWVIGRACGVAALWPQPLNVSVNLSPEQFRCPGISQVIAAALDASGLEPHRLEVEITEGMLLDNSEAVMAELRAIKALGVSIAMDDFGTGYSSLSYLLRFPFNKLKIDRSLLKDAADDNAEVRNVLETIVTLGHKLHMLVVAEGVETQLQAKLLNDLACDEIQGFLFGRPMPETDVAALILNTFQRQIFAAPATDSTSAYRHVQAG